MAVAVPPRGDGAGRGGSLGPILGVVALPAAALAALMFILIILAGDILQPPGCKPTAAGGSALPGNLDAPGSLGMVGGTGLSRAQIEAVRSRSGGDPKITPGRYSSTGYGPPWGIDPVSGVDQGPGIATAGGIVLNGGSPRYYMVAVDTAQIGLGALVYAWPNPFNWRGPFLAADTGGAINAKDMDFYDWRGRSTQLGWGRRQVQVSAEPIKGGGPDDEDQDDGAVLVDTGPGAETETADGGAGGFDTAVDAAREVEGRPVGFAVVDANGEIVAQLGANQPNLGRSATKALVLVALTRTARDRALTASEKQLATAMIEQSDNAAASRLYRQVGGPAVDRAARAAGMTGFTRDTSDPVYTLGESTITAVDLARLFALLDELLPERHQAFAHQVLGNIQGAGHFGLLEAGLPGTVLSKGGWSPEGSRGWTVNQGAQIELDGLKYGVAIVLGGQADFAAGATAIQRIGQQLAIASPTGAQTTGNCGGEDGAAVLASGELGLRIAEIARSHLGSGPSIAGFEPPSTSLAWCAWFVSNVWRKAGVDIPITHASNDPYNWAAGKGLLFKKVGEPPKSLTPPVGAALMYGSGPQSTGTSAHINLVDKVNPDGSFMVTGGNQTNPNGGANIVTRHGPCRLTKSATTTLVGCDPRVVYGIALPGRETDTDTDTDTADETKVDGKPSKRKKDRA